MNEPVVVIGSGEMGGVFTRGLLRIGHPAGDLEHKCMGRSAQGRLARAISHADEAGLDVPKLREIHQAQKKNCDRQDIEKQL